MRSTLTSLAAFVMLFLSGCATVDTTEQQKVSAIAADVSLIAEGLQPIVAQVASLSGANTDTLAKLNTGLAVLATAAKSASTAATLADSTTAVNLAINALSDIAGALATLPDLPVKIRVSLAAAQALTPVIKTLAGIAATAYATDTVAPDEARLILKAETLTPR